MEREREIRKQMAGLCHEQRFAVLATSGESGPYTSLIAFAASEGCRELLFATARSTRKFANMREDERVSLLIDNRINHVEDTFEASGMTLIGTAQELSDEERADAQRNYLRRHPHLESFLFSENVALMRVRVQRAIVVNRFQEVFELDLTCMP